MRPLKVSALPAARHSDQGADRLAVSKEASAGLALASHLSGLADNRQPDPVSGVRRLARRSHSVSRRLELNRPSAGLQ